MGGKIEPRQVKTGQDRVRKGKERQDKEKGKKRQDLGGKRVEWVILRPGGLGVKRPLGGYPQRCLGLGGWVAGGGVPGGGKLVHLGGPGKP